MEKLLPIKFFEKRKIDEQLTEGGGGKPPKWVLQDQALLQHSQHLVQNVNQVAAAFETHKKEIHELPMVMTTTISEDAIAKSHRGSVVDLLNSDRQPNVIGVDSVPEADKVILKPQAPARLRASGAGWPTTTLLSSCLARGSSGPSCQRLLQIVPPAGGFFVCVKLT